MVGAEQDGWPIPTAVLWSLQVQEVWCPHREDLQQDTEGEVCLGNRHGRWGLWILRKCLLCHLKLIWCCWKVGLGLLFLTCCCSCCRGGSGNDLNQFDMGILYLFFWYIWKETPGFYLKQVLLISNTHPDCSDFDVNFLIQSCQVLWIFFFHPPSPLESGKKIEWEL